MFQVKIDIDSIPSGYRQCTVCLKVIKKTSYTRHMRIHTGDKPFACELCDYRSNQKSNLRLHIRQMHNTGDEEVPEYVCHICNYRSKQSSNLNSHIRNKHNLNWPIRDGRFTKLDEWDCSKSTSLSIFCHTSFFLRELKIEYRTWFVVNLICIISYLLISL